MRRVSYTTSWDEVPIVMDIPFAARILALTPEALIKRCQKGQFPGFKEGKVWRITKDELLAHIERNTRRAHTDER